MVILEFYSLLSTQIPVELCLDLKWWGNWKNEFYYTIIEHVKTWKQVRKGIYFLIVFRFEQTKHHLWAQLPFSQTQYVS